MVTATKRTSTSQCDVSLRKEDVFPFRNFPRIANAFAFILPRDWSIIIEKAMS